MACELAGRISSQAVAPFRIPRALFYSFSLALLALGLVAVRYRLEGRLDLHPPMAAILKQLLRASPPDLEKLARLIPKPSEEEKQDVEEPEESRDGKPQKGDPSQRQATKSSGAQKAEKQNTGQGQQEAKNQEQPGDSMDENDTSGQNSDAQQNSGQRNATAAQQGQSRSGQRDEKSASNSSSDGESGAFSKMRDALSQMLSMLKPSPGSGSRQQISANRGGKSRGGERKGQSTPQEGSSSDDASGAEGSEAPQPGAAKSGSGQGKDSDSAKQAASGAGNNDGKKDIRDAEMLQAMGKISTIFGKRSENMSGTAEVEVVSGNQQLATGYETKAVRHTDAHAAADRDEVPIELQNYVKRYLSSVHTAGEARRAKTK
jgi:hypothetical protein